MMKESMTRQLVTSNTLAKSQELFFKMAFFYIPEAFAA
jgi:hypothetical protein